MSVMKVDSLLWIYTGMGIVQHDDTHHDHKEAISLYGRIKASGGSTICSLWSLVSKKQMFGQTALEMSAFNCVNSSFLL